MSTKRMTQNAYDYLNDAFLALDATVTGVNDLELQKRLESIKDEIDTILEEEEVSD